MATVKVKKHKVRDVQAPRHDREVSGKGHFGVCYGGLSGDGDVKLVATAVKARDLTMKILREAFDTNGMFVRTNYITAEDGVKMISEGATQLSYWSDMQSGSTAEVAVQVPGLTVVRVGVFHADHVHNGYVNVHTIPYRVRLPDGAKRELKE